MQSQSCLKMKQFLVLSLAIAVVAAGPSRLKRQDAEAEVKAKDPGSPVDGSLDEADEKWRRPGYSQTSYTHTIAGDGYGDRAGYAGGYQGLRGARYADAGAGYQGDDGRYQQELGGRYEGGVGGYQKGLGGGYQQGLRSGYQRGFGEGYEGGVGGYQQGLGGGYQQGLGGAYQQGFGGGYQQGLRSGYQRGLGEGYEGGIGGGAYPGGPGYQQDQGYAAAKVQFAKIGPNGRSAVAY